MRKVLLTTLALFLVVGLAGLSVQHYKNYKNKKLLEERAAQQVVIDRNAEVIRALEAAQQKISKLTVECQKGRAIYATLTPATQARTQAPTCTIQ